MVAFRGQADPNDGFRAEFAGQREVIALRRRSTNRSFTRRTARTDPGKPRLLVMAGIYRATVYWPWLSSSTKPARFWLPSIAYNGCWRPTVLS